MEDDDMNLVEDVDDMDLVEDADDMDFVVVGDDDMAMDDEHDMAMDAKHEEKYMEMNCYEDDNSMFHLVPVDNIQMTDYSDCHYLIAVTFWTREVF